MFFMPATIDSRTAPPADAVILQSSAPRRFLFVREDFLRPVRRFTGIALLPSPQLNQRDHRAVDFVVDGAIGTHPQRVLTAFRAFHFSLSRV